MRRRNLLAGMVGAGAAGLGTSWHMSGKLPAQKPIAAGNWANWSRNQTATPSFIKQPENLQALKSTIKGSPGPIRMVGAGHSFTALVPTTGTIVNLDKMNGLISVNKVEKSAWVHAGTRLHDLSVALEAKGLAFKNLGDVDIQSLAGAIGTATHGTGKNFKCLSGEILAVKILTANGDILTASADENPDLLSASQVSMGALGVITEAKVSLTDNYKLRRRTWIQPLKETLATAEANWDKYRNFEFYYIPYTNATLCISHEKTSRPPTPRNAPDDDGAVMEMKQLRDFVKWNPKLRRRIISKAIAEVEVEDTIDVSWKLLATERNVPFNEIEYHLPVDAGLKALEEIIYVIENEHPDVFLPLEIRRTHGDSAWLSPFQGEARISIAVHAYYKDDFNWFFEAIEPIFRRARGRPHWGKLHSLGARELKDLYPDFNRFTSLRQELDPAGKFMNPFMQKLWMEQ